MYCDDSEGCDIDHFRPKSLPVYRGRVFDWDNLLWACTPCNRAKLAGFVDGAIDPFVTDPIKHLDLSPSTGNWTARLHCEGDAGTDTTVDARGAATLCTLPTLNRQPVAEGRQSAWRWLCAMLLDLYDALSSQGDAARAVLVQQQITQDPFSDVFAWMVGVLDDPLRSAAVPPRVREIIGRHPTMRDWLAEDDEARWQAAQSDVAAAAAGIRLRRPR